MILFEKRKTQPGILNLGVELYNSKTYVSGQSLISFRRRAGIGYVFSEAKSENPPNPSNPMTLKTLG